MGRIAEAKSHVRVGSDDDATQVKSRAKTPSWRPIVQLLARPIEEPNGYLPSPMPQDPSKNGPRSLVDTRSVSPNVDRADHAKKRVGQRIDIAPDPTPPLCFAAGIIWARFSFATYI
jgi:hypothetical protein